jgi:hypothetical protein
VNRRDVEVMQKPVGNTHSLIVDNINNSESRPTGTSAGALKDTSVESAAQPRGCAAHPSRPIENDEMDSIV